MPPIIGLTTYGFREKHNASTYYEHHYAVPKEYVDAITRAGGIPLLIPANKNDWQALWSVLDGIVVTGGTDVNPQFYNGETANPKVHADDAERDATEIELIRHAAESNHKPILCVCRGVQVLNVALGGTLHAHIPDIREQDIHRNHDGLWTTHDCHMDSQSRLAQIMGAETVHTYSGHHQALDRVAEGLQVVATAPDGIVEAVISSQHPWLIGVQWHPEKSAAEDPTQQRLFDDLVRFAGEM
ncbi:MAG: gamma-glutamyl-gamma-aminobutyrate hydrolase family protein [Anaerolineae bacterium]|nr:gamma-glutamyl-gamma-aminobutyrate hydrolase family protein [Anaerolineae bacterium]